MLKSPIISREMFIYTPSCHRPRLKSRRHRNIFLCLLSFLITQNQLLNLTKYIILKFSKVATKEQGSNPIKIEILFSEVSHSIFFQNMEQMLMKFQKHFRYLNSIKWKYVNPTPQYFINLQLKTFLKFPLKTLDKKVDINRIFYIIYKFYWFLIVFV